MKRSIVAALLAVLLPLTGAAPASAAPAAPPSRLAAFEACLDRTGGTNLLLRAANLSRCAGEAGFPVTTVTGCLRAGDGAAALVERITRVGDCLDEAGIKVTEAAGETVLLVYVLDIIRSASGAATRDARALVAEVQSELVQHGTRFEALRAEVRRQAARPRAAVEVIRETLTRFGDIAGAISAAAQAWPEIDASLTRMNAGVARANSGMQRMNDAMVQVNDALDRTDAALDKANQGLDQLNAGIAEANAAMARMNEAVDRANAAMAEINTAVAGIRTAAAEITVVSGNLFAGMWQRYDEHTRVTLQYDLEDFLGRPLENEIGSLLLDLVPGLGDAKGVQELVTGRDLVTGDEVPGVERALGAIVVFQYARPLYKGGDSLVNAARLRGVLDATQKGNEVVDSLKATGRLPAHYITQDQAAATYGWEKGKALAPKAPGKALGGDVFRNDSGVLPGKPGRTWYEADIGQDYTKKRANNPGTRLLYSSDGLMYVTPDHYDSVYYIGRYK